MYIILVALFDTIHSTSALFPYFKTSMHSPTDVLFQNLLHFLLNPVYPLTLLRLNSHPLCHSTAHNALFFFASTGSSFTCHITTNLAEFSLTHLYSSEEKYHHKFSYTFILWVLKWGDAEGSVFDRMFPVHSWLFLQEFSPSNWAALVVMGPGQKF